ncbi:MAG TPA: glycosyltransferase [Bacteroidales bacterium]|nr:glycosyltransferase [Bacteroidales bacterium]
MTFTEFIPEQPLLFWLLVGFAAVTMVQLIYFWLVFVRLAFYKKTFEVADETPVSIVIMANNQYRDVNENLAAFLEQVHRRYEVVLVVDNSEDGTMELMDEFTAKYPHLRIVELTQSLNWFSGRKFPLSLGIKSAYSDLILLTDINCCPANEQWISEMTAAMQPGREIVLGYASWRTTSRINKWLRFTAFYDALLYLSMALSGIPFKGIGRNLSYTRELFYRNKGFSAHYTINAGDDELFVNKTATRKNVSVQISAGSRIDQVRPYSFRRWLISEKKRLGMRHYFKTGHRVLIETYTLSLFLFYTLLAALLLLKAPWISVAAIFALRFISQLILFGLIQKRLHEKNLLLLTPFFELFLLLIGFFIRLRLLFSRKRKWH